MEAKRVDRNDIKLLLDVECQDIATRIILDHFPDHAILGEEDDPSTPVASVAPDSYEWIIDPIDGTINFSHGSPFWCCSVAVRRNGDVLAGCVSAPDLGLLFEATLDSAPLRNGHPIRVSETGDLALSLVHSGADRNDPTHPWRFFNAIADAVQRPRCYGSAALDICFVASGACEGFFEPGIYTWDTAAADLILRRAGGRSSILRRWGAQHFAYLASNANVHAALEKIVTPLLG